VVIISGSRPFILSSAEGKGITKSFSVNSVSSVRDPSSDPPKAGKPLSSDVRPLVTNGSLECCF